MQSTRGPHEASRGCEVPHGEAYWMVKATVPLQLEVE